MTIENINDDKIRFFQKTILLWYKKNGRTFYWRLSKLSPYQYIIAEVLLQRTKAETIARFYPSFIGRFPDWDSLAEAPPQEVEEFLKPVGLYRQRSSRLLGLAKEMVRRQGKLPVDREELESIPFMGQYIANAVELVVFNQPSPLVDVNMSRVLERFFGPREMADIRYDPYLQRLSYRVVNHKRSKEINWGILDYAAIICRPKPLCLNCLFSKECKYFNVKIEQLESKANE